MISEMACTIKNIKETFFLLIYPFYYKKILFK